MVANCGFIILFFLAIAEVKVAVFLLVVAAGAVTFCN
jgi:hypothetical protein